MDQEATLIHGPCPTVLTARLLSGALLKSLSSPPDAATHGRGLTRVRLMVTSQEGAWWAAGMLATGAAV